MTKPFTEQTGWKRPYPKAICQDWESLSRVNEFSFDVNNSEFIEYFRCRTGVVWDDHKAWITTSDDAENWLLNSLDFKYMISQEPIEFGREREVKVLLNRILKGQLQDCWELFTIVENSSWKHKYINLMEN